MAPTDKFFFMGLGCSSCPSRQQKNNIPTSEENSPALNWALTSTDFILSQYKAEARELGNKHRALPQELSMFNMENYRTPTRLFYFAQLHIFQEHRGSDRLPGSHFVHAQHGGWTAGSRTVIQELLAPAVEADGQQCSPSLQLTEKLVSNLERKRALSNSWYRDRYQQGVTTCPLIFWATNAHSSIALAFIH